MKKILITGCNGLLGQKLIERSGGHYHLIGTDLHEKPLLTRPEFEYLSLDITKRQEVKKVLTHYQPAWIINTGAYNNVDGAETEKELCWRVNVTGVENLIYGARKIGASILHLSSDYIFDGTNGPYCEEDVPNPLSFYGRSKLASENALLASNISYTIVRTMVLYGKGIQTRANFVTWLIDTLIKGGSVTIVDDQRGNPTLADDLARGLWRIVERNKQGIYHLSGSELIDRYHFALKIAEVFELDPQLIRRAKTSEIAQPAQRPLKSGFILEKAEKELGLKMLNVHEGLTLFKNQIG